MSIINNNEGNNIFTNIMNKNEINKIKDEVKTYFKINNKKQVRPFYNGLMSNTFRKFLNKNLSLNIDIKPIFNDVNLDKYYKVFNNKIYSIDELIKNNKIDTNLINTIKGNRAVKRFNKNKKNKPVIYSLQALPKNKEQQKFNVIRQDYKFLMSNGDKETNLNVIKGLMYNVDKLLENNKIGDYGIRLVFSTKEGNHFSTDYDYKGSWDIDNIINLIGNSHYNNELNSGDINIEVHTNGSPIGGCNFNHTLDNPFWLNGKKCLFPINDDTILDEDKLCGQRSLVLSLQTKTKLDRLRKKPTKNDPNTSLEKKILPKFLKSFGIKKEMTYKDFNIFHNLYNIRVLIWRNQISSIFDTSDYEDSIYNKTVHIFHYNNHYQLITNIHSFINRDNNFKYCELCNVVYGVKSNHKCKNSCFSCDRPYKECKDCLKCKSKKYLRCEECNIFCQGLDCLAHHKKIKHIYNKNKDGKYRIGDIKPCKFWKCEKCKSKFEKSHKQDHICGEEFCNNCKIYHLDKDKHRCNVMRQELKSKKIIQTYIAFDFECFFDKFNYHICNLVRTQNLESGERLRFKNIEDFTSYWSQQKNTTFIAHNLKGYDGFILLNHLVRNNQNQKPDFITLAGNKIMTMSFKTVKFIDSLNFLQMRLSDFPKTFCLGDDFKKGYFPYIFNKKINFGYKGKIPSRQYYEPQKMSCFKGCCGMCKVLPLNKNPIECSYCDFNKWYDEQEDKLYDFDKELEDYCISDVDILAKGLNVFRRDMMAINEGIDPLESITIASYAMKIYKTLHAPTENQLDTEYDGKISIIDNNIGDSTAFSVLKDDEYKKIKKSFYGGRTEVFRLYSKMSNEDIKNGRYIRYIDIKSLYPSSQFLDYLPYGTPKTITYNNIGINGNTWVENNKNFFGFVRCDIAPPKNLFIPLLPNKNFNEITQKREGKLVFSCEDMRNATIPSPEFWKSIELGYKVGNVYETIEFKKSKHLFRDYIRKFMKIKEENAGSKLNQIELKKYCDEWENRYDIHLEPDKFKKRPSYKSLAKLLLNSLWGRWGMKCDMPNNEFIGHSNIDKWYELQKLHKKGDVLIKNREDLKDGSGFFISYIDNREEKSSRNKTNIAVCSMITSNARLRLYEVLEKLDNRVIYCDTDSVVYIHDEKLDNPLCGDFLGEWENELDEGKDGVINEFLGLLPKTYSYKTTKNKLDIKSKGITLSYENLKNINFDTYKNLVEDNNIKLTANNLVFKKAGIGKELSMKTIIGAKKEIGLDASKFKRQIINKYDTLPYGYMK